MAAESPLVQNQEKKKKNKSFMTSPMISKLYRISEQATEVSDTATYGGITWKTIFFLLLTVAGAMLYAQLHPMMIVGSESFETMLYEVPIKMFYSEIGWVGLATLLTCLLPFITFFAKGAAAVLGSVYAVAQGYLLGFIAVSLGSAYTGYLLAAFAITVGLVLVMLILYATRIVKVGKKFRTVMLALILLSVLTSIISFVTVIFLPQSGLGKFLIENVNGIGIACAAFGVIIATLFLLSDFDTIEKTVENHLPKKYEWLAAFGLAFTVIWLYLKVLQLIVMAAGNNKN